jgi:hypothetical protein
MAISPRFQGELINGHKKIAASPKKKDKTATSWSVTNGGGGTGKLVELFVAGARALDSRHIAALMAA